MSCVVDCNLTTAVCAHFGIRLYFLVQKMAESAQYSDNFCFDAFFTSLLIGMIIQTFEDIFSKEKA